MSRLSGWFTKNPVAANLLMVLIVISGLLTLRSIRIEGFPAIAPKTVVVTTIYPGASPETVDAGVTRKIEESLVGMAGIRRISSTSEESYSTVYVEKTVGTQIDRFQNDIQARVDAIPGFPQNAERPQVGREEFSISALLVQVYGDVDTKELQQVAGDLKAELLRRPEIVRIDAFGMLSPEIHINVDEERLRAHGMSYQEIAEVIQTDTTPYRTGSLQGANGRISIKTDNEATTARDIAGIPLRASSDGAVLTIGDFAEVEEGFGSSFITARYQGLPSVGFEIYTSKKGNLIEVSRAARETVKDFRTHLPEDLDVEVWGDASVYMKERLSLLGKNAWQGLLIVFVLLALFLNVKLAFWVAAGIPISLAGTLALMNDRFLGYSLNDITTFGMIVVLGILVDDAIVVGESVFEARQLSTDRYKATIKGVHKVSTATIFGCFTTVAAFFPILMIENDIGRIFASFSVVVIVSLLVSLLESKMILPAHLAAIRSFDFSPRNKVAAVWTRVQSWVSRGLDYLNHRVYQPILKAALRYKMVSLFMLLTMATVGLTLLARGFIPTVFFPDVPGQTITINLEMKGGSSVKLLSENIAALEEAAKQINRNAVEETGNDLPPIAAVMTAVTGPCSAYIFADLQPEKTRSLETLEVIRRWRVLAGNLEGTEQLHFTGSMSTGGGFSVRLRGKDSALLEEALAAVRTELASISGISDIRDDYGKGTSRIILRLKPEARSLGLSNGDLAVQIGDAFGGLEIQRVQDGLDEVKVFLRRPDDRKQSMDDLLGARIRTSSGQTLPLPLVAEIDSGFEPATIVRRDRQRAVTVSATVDREMLSPAQALEWLIERADVTRRFPGIVLEGAGEFEELSDMKGTMKGAFIVIIFLIYALLAIPLKSYGQPLVIMSVIPFGFIGSIIGHMVFGVPLSILSFFGMMAVMGVVVNDSLVMITRFNEVKNEGRPVYEALIAAGGSRFRPILLTTITTVSGLMPLMSETSEQAAYLIPAAISLAWGEIFATPITLFIVPVILSIAEDAKNRIRKFRESRRSDFSLDAGVTTR